MAWAYFSWTTLFAPLSMPLAELFKGQSEAYALYSFMAILFMLVSLEADKQAANIEAGNSSRFGSCITSSNQSTEPRADVIRALQHHGPQKYFAVPPFGCCFQHCCKPHRITARQLLWVASLVRQYVVAQLFIHAWIMWAGLTLEPKWKATSQLTTVLEVSGLLAMYGLFVLYGATHDLLQNWNTSKKFISVKVMIVLSTIQEMVFSLLIRDVFPQEKVVKSCWVDPEHPEDIERAVQFWTSFANLLETVMISYLITQAFPASDVSDHPVQHLDLMELELRLVRREQP